jgi:hypothetical protein
MQDQHAVPQVYDQMTTCTKGETLEIPKSLAPAKSEAFYKTLFQGNNKLQKGSSLLSSSGSTLITLSLIYSKPEKFASGNKIGDKLQQSKDC